MRSKPASRLASCRIPDDTMTRSDLVCIFWCLNLCCLYDCRVFFLGIAHSSCPGDWIPHKCTGEVSSFFGKIIERRDIGVSVRWIHRGKTCCPVFGVWGPVTAFALGCSNIFSQVSIQGLESIPEQVHAHSSWLKRIPFGPINLHLSQAEMETRSGHAVRKVTHAFHFLFQRSFVDLTCISYWIKCGP